MLAANTYPKDYIAACRGNVDRQLTTYQQFVKSAHGPDAAESQQSAQNAFERLFFRNLVVLLDAMFVHRTRAREGKDGNPMNEVRMLGESVLGNGSVLAGNSTIKYDPAKSVLGLRIGDDIQISEAAFKRLAQAFFAEIKAKFA